MPLMYPDSWVCGSDKERHQEEAWYMARLDGGWKAWRDEPGMAQPARAPQTQGQETNKCWLVLILSDKRLSSDSWAKLHWKRTINLGLV